jgi:hypothetical protein
MFDDLRNVQQEPAPMMSSEPGSSLVERLPILSRLRPQQRFILAVLLFLNVAVLGCGCLMAFDRIVP